MDIKCYRQQCQVLPTTISMSNTQNVYLKGVINKIYKIKYTQDMVSGCMNFSKNPVQMMVNNKMAVNWFTYMINKGVALIN